MNSSIFQIFLYLGLVFLPFMRIQATSLNVKDYEKTPKTAYAIKTLLNRYDKEDLIKQLRKIIAATRPSRMVGTEGHEKAREYLTKKIKGIDSPRASFRIHEFRPDIDHAIKEYESDFQKKIAANYDSSDETYKKWRRFTDSVTKTLKGLKGTKGKNLIWEKKGNKSPQEVLVLGAHYDTIHFDPESNTVKAEKSAPGADDNGSGVAALLAMMEYLAKMDLPKTVRIIFFDFQELGTLGSHAYVNEKTKKLQKEVVAYLNVEKIGYDSKAFDDDEKLGNYKAYIRREGTEGYKEDKKMAEYIGKMVEKTSSRVDFELHDNGFSGSDHQNFWQAGIPAVNFTQNYEKDSNEKRHHTSDDFVETLNQKTFYEAFQGLTGAVICWAFGIEPTY